MNEILIDPIGAARVWESGQPAPPPKRQQKKKSEYLNVRHTKNVSVPVSMAEIGKRVYPGSNNIAASLMLPHAFPPRRFASQFTSCATAVASPFAVRQLDWTAGATDAVQTVPNGQMFVAVSRNPLQAYASYKLNSGYTDGEYKFLFPFPSTNGFADTLNIVNSVPGVPLQIDAQVCEDVYAGNPLRYHPHGDYYYPVDALGRKGVHVTATATKPASFFFVQTITSGTAANPRIVVYRWVGNAWAEAAQLSPSGNIFTLTVGSGGTGYYSFAYVDNAATNVNLTGVFRVTCDAIGFEALPHFRSMWATIDTMRVNAVSLMVTPHPAMLYEGGQVSGVQLPTTLQIADICEQGDPFTFVSQAAQSKTLPLKKGMFGFHKPTDMSDFSEEDVVSSRGSVVNGFSNPMQPHGGWLVIAALVGKVDTAWPSGACHVTVCYGIEYRTTNVWMVSMPPQHSADDFATALAIMRATEQWHENPMHMADILAVLKRAGKTALRISPLLLKVLQAVYPATRIPEAFAEGLAALGHAL